MRLAVIHQGQVRGVYEGRDPNHILDLFAQDHGYKNFHCMSKTIQTEAIVSDVVETTLDSLPSQFGRKSDFIKRARKAHDRPDSTFEMPCDPDDYKALKAWANEAECQVDIRSGSVCATGVQSGLIMDFVEGDLTLEQARELVGLDDRRSSGAQCVEEQLDDDPDLKDISIETVSAILAACGINNEIVGGSILLECVEVGGNTVKRIDRPPIDIDDIRVDAHRLKTEPGV